MCSFVSCIGLARYKLLHDTGRVRRRQVLHPEGELHVTLKLVPPYSRWDIDALAKEAGYTEKRREDGPFKTQQFPGYSHCTTLATAHPLDVSSKEALENTKIIVFGREHGAPACTTRLAIDECTSSCG